MFAQPAYDKDVGNFGGFWLVAWWGTREVLGLMGKEGSDLRCSEHPQGWNVLNKDLPHATLTVPSLTKATCGQPQSARLVLVSSITLCHSKQTLRGLIS